MISSKRAFAGARALDEGLTRLFLAALKLLSRIPLQRSQSIGRRFGLLLGLLLRGRCRIVREGFAHAFGREMSEGEREALLRRFLSHFGQVAFEIPHIFRLTKENLPGYVTFENERALVSALRKGRGALLLTAHYGNWELMSVAIALHLSIEGGVVARPIDFPPADRLMEAIRGRFGTEIVPKQRSMKRLLSGLRQNKPYGILLDQNVDWYEGVFTPFLGRWACTNKGLALLAQKTGAPVLPVFSYRCPDGRYRVVFEDPLILYRSGDRTRDMEENTLLFTQVIERFVRLHPEQWFWFHRRWKTRPFCPLPEREGA